MTNDTLPTNTVAPEKKINAEIVKANFNLELSKLKYQDALAALVEVEVTRENVVDVQQKLKDARKFLTKFDDIKKKGKAEAWAICNWWDDAYNGTKAAFESELNQKAQQVTKIANEINEENQRIEAEKQRKAGILSEIDNFFINQSQAIAAATEPAELVRIEKLIGSHKGNSSRYQEFLPQMAEKAEVLAQLIKTQKDAIKKIADLRAKEQAAMQSGDDERVLELREKQEEITQTIEQTKISVQESAISMATKADIVEAEVIQMTAPKPSRRLWKYEVVDEKAANKAGLMKLVPDTEKIDARLKEIREEETEITENGIRYYIFKKF